MDTTPLTKEDLYAILSQELPRQNDFAVSDYSEEREELYLFGIRTKTALMELIAKQKQALMAIDAEPLDDFHVRCYKKEYGDEQIQQKIDNKFWFAYPALLRIMLELEFGEEYTRFANVRDHI